MRRFQAATALLAGMLAATPPASAASQSRTATMTANVAGLAKLNLSALSLSFPNADPDTTPSIQAAGGAITIGARARTTPGSAVTLTVQASDDLRSGTDVIPVAALTWSAAGAGFVGGTMSKAVAQTVGSWVDSGARSGTQTYALQNAWSYPTGTYTMTLTYTLAAP